VVALHGGIWGHVYTVLCEGIDMGAWPAPGLGEGWVKGCSRVLYAINIP
jgi:hypothetical protein